MSEQDIFEKFGLEVTLGQVEVGKTFPLYGLITEFLSEEEGDARVRFNNSNVILKMNVPLEKISILKERSFEPGIFVTTIVEANDELILGDCTTVIFGKRQEQHEQ